LLKPDDGQATSLLPSGRPKYNNLKNERKKIMSQMILEIAPTSGTESEYLARELATVYEKFANKNGLTLTRLSPNSRTIRYELSGNPQAIITLSQEAGSHRFQWQPHKFTVQENRVQTNVVMVFVVEDVGKPSVEIRDADLVIDIKRGSGKGGQKRNKTETAVQIHHLPSGIVVYCDDERSKLSNMKRAKAELQRRLEDKAMANASNIFRDTKQKQMGRGTQFGPRRTYNYQRGEVVDHATGAKYPLARIMVKANIE
jgi:peptide chain release factor 1